DPQRYVAKMTKSLRKGKIFVDYLRNSLEQTSVAAYSTRARVGAPVSVPISWQELGRTTGGNQYTVLNLMKRLGALKQDPWADIGRVKQKLPQLPTRGRGSLPPPGAPLQRSSRRGGNGTYAPASVLGHRAHGMIAENRF